jgi:DDE superfamily endonuclease
MEYVQGDLDDTDALRSALTGGAAAHLSARGGPTAESYDRVERRGPARVAELAALAWIGRLTYVSHMLAAPDAAAPSLRAKFHVEQAIAASAVPFTIFRRTSWRPFPGRSAAPGRSSSADNPTCSTCSRRPTSRARWGAPWRRLGRPVSAWTCTVPQAPGTQVVTRPLWFMTVPDRTVLRGQLRGTLELMRAMQRSGERGDPSQANRLLGDGLSSHWSHRMRTHMDTRRDWLTVERLPAYAPELNPVEFLWANLKAPSWPASLATPSPRSPTRPSVASGASATATYSSSASSAVPGLSRDDDRSP